MNTRNRSHSISTATHQQGSTGFSSLSLDGLSFFYFKFFLAINLITINED